MDFVTIGRTCKQARREAHETALQVSRELYCSPDNIYKFEKGQNRNGEILLWYLKRYFDGDVYTMEGVYYDN